MPAIGRNKLQPYVQEINRLTGKELRIDYHSAGYQLESADGSINYGPRTTPKNLVFYLQGLIRGLCIMNECQPTNGIQTCSPKN